MKFLATWDHNGPCSRLTEDPYATVEKLDEAAAAAGEWNVGELESYHDCDDDTDAHLRARGYVRYWPTEPHSAWPEHGRAGLWVPPWEDAPPCDANVGD